jgi:microcystin-dependent protein
MAEPFLSEIRLMSFGFAPNGWALCNGQFLPINQNQALFSLLGTTYGGNGQTTFALPDLRGRVPIHFGSGHSLGEQGGEQAHTLSINELAAHSHAPAASTAATTPDPAGAVWADPGKAAYGNGGAYALDPAAIGSVGGSQAHLNMQPYLTLSFCIALQGIFPSQN